MHELITPIMIGVGIGLAVDVYVSLHDLPEIKDGMAGLEYVFIPAIFGVFGLVAGLVMSGK